jgi:hypothetical protein
VVATVGTPDHNELLPPAFASYEPHHGQGLDRSTVRSQDTQNPDARHIESQTRRDPQRYGTNQPRSTPTSSIRTFGVRIDGGRPASLIA